MNDFSPRNDDSNAQQIRSLPPRAASPSFPVKKLTLSPIWVFLSASQKRIHHMFHLHIRGIIEHFGCPGVLYLGRDSSRFNPSGIAEGWKRKCIFIYKNTQERMPGWMTGGGKKNINGCFFLLVSSLGGEKYVYAVFVETLVLILKFLISLCKAGVMLFDLWRTKTPCTLNETDFLQRKKFNHTFEKNKFKAATLMFPLCACFFIIILLSTNRPL